MEKIVWQREIPWQKAAMGLENRLAYAARAWDGFIDVDADLLELVLKKLKEYHSLAVTRLENNPIERTESKTQNQQGSDPDE